MPEYLIELYVPAAGSSSAGTGAGSVRQAVTAVAAQGNDAQYLRSIYVAADETCFVLIDAETIEIAQEVARRADVAANRVSEVASEPSDSDRWQPAANATGGGAP
jgi:hypothetical protein